MSSKEEELEALQIEALKGIFARSVMHDLNNALQPVIGYASLARRKMKEVDPSSEDLEEVLAGARRMKRILQQAVSYTKSYEAGKSGAVKGLVRSLLEDEAMLRMGVSSQIQLSIVVEPDLRERECASGRGRAALFALLSDWVRGVSRLAKIVRLEIRMSTLSEPGMARLGFLFELAETEDLAEQVGWPAFEAMDWFDSTLAGAIVASEGLKVNRPLATGAALVLGVDVSLDAGA